MPQGRRKVPFSGKAKKQQLQAKKQRQRDFSSFDNGNDSFDEEESLSDQMNYKEYKKEIQKINKQPRANNRSNQSDRNKFSLQFFQESEEELRKRKLQAFKTIESISLQNQEISDDYFPSTVDMPKRPPWDFNMTRELLETKEQKYFTEYLTNIEELNRENLSYFELNLETWRQLWRVLEMSDILLIIVDIRYPVLSFPPYLYEYVTKQLQKDMILILNKIDLAPAALVVAWKEYFRNKYPKLHILMFTSYPAYTLHGNTSNENTFSQKRRKGKLKMAAEGAQKLLEACKNIVGDKVDLSPWQKKIQEEMHMEYNLDEISHKDSITLEQQDSAYFKHEKYKNGVLTIGCIGTPNVGKSSLMNALMGKKVVSVSRTPGHTKHFQTIFLTNNVCLCDCPGLVFPSIVPKQLQILMGSYPIAQVREPYTTVKFMAERLDLPKILNIPHPENDDTWSAMDICDGWAIKRDFKTSRAARLDTYRSANSLLRMTLEGKICLHTYPPKWANEKANWESHEDIEMVRWIQAKNQSDGSDKSIEYISSDDEDSEDSGKQKSPQVSNDASNNCTVETSCEKNFVPPITNKFAALCTEE